MINICSSSRDTTKTSGMIDYEDAKYPFSLGLEYTLNKNINLGISFERGTPSL